MGVSKDPRLKIFIITIVVLVVGSIIAGIIFAKSEKNGGIPEMKIDSLSFDFGTISMGEGLAKHTFAIKNEGTGDLKVSEISTSCMCTTAIFELEGEKSQTFGMHNNSLFWSKKIKPGQQANLEVIFDPLAHGPDETGPITRTVTMWSNDGGGKNKKTVFTINGNVVK